MKKNKSFLIFFLALFISFQAFAQQVDGSIFKAGDKVNFIGNSITHGGGFHNHLLLYYATRFPGESIMFYNSGISGDNAKDIFRRLDDDIIPRMATWSVVMAGMNDVNRALYAPSRKGEPGLEEQKQRAIRDYRTNLDNVLQKLSQTGTKLILQTPSIYDQTALLSSENHMGVNDALQQCAAIVRELAKKYNACVVDYWGFMGEVNQRLQQTDPAATIISIDRVHPWGTGDLIMAYQFLKETGAPSVVSEVEIEKGAVKNCVNCKVTVIKAGKMTITFQVTEKSLPFPVEDEPQTTLALSLVPLMEQLNREMLRVSKLKAGRYSLQIDGILIGEFTNEALASGINLALYRNTPQYQQALQVKEKAAAYRALQRKLRDIKWVQNRHLPFELWNAETAVSDKYITDRLESLKASNAGKYEEASKYFSNYLKLKPKEKAMEVELVELNKAIYQFSNPVAHHYKITALR